METINLNELKNYGPELIKAFLAPLAEPGKHLEFIISKRELNPASPDWSVACMYIEAAYIGYELKKASGSFAYYAPCPTLMEPFRFIIDCTDMPAMVNAISYIVSGYFNNKMDFFDAANQHYEASIDDGDRSAVWGLIHIGNDYLARFHESGNKNGEKPD